MVVLKSFIILAVGMYSSSVSAECSFRNDDAIKKKPVGGEDYNLRPDPHYSWSNVRGVTTVRYIFDKSVEDDQLTKKAFLDVMRELEARSCLKFVPTKSKSQKYLFIFAGNDCMFNDVTGGVKYDSGLQTQTLEMSHRLCNRNLQQTKTSYYKVIRHEFLHVFGLMHTQTRWDRNQYVNVNTKNLVDSKEARYQYEICKDCDTLDAPYECNSIMHYKTNTYAINPEKPVMTSINKSCIIKPSNYLTNEDWKLLNKAAKCPKI
ncbi:low choriolytic enzyme [Eurytemora carolleeae]|uniref:low choriolytic enzyme n=1 Tax=Eurytemora carolleeae TaxID=1294199 RepID=UPI000C7930A5|nr:low choriolytic enzyme [Eurytemora carolleeae]|eukprot:XP_023345708.1 low choriolytic enzyme-like [Eurytemora affinis]